MTSPVPPQPIPSPLGENLRPSPARTTSLAAPIPNHPAKSRAASQPAGERLPVRSGSAGGHNATGRDSPGGLYGVIGGSRTPSKQQGAFSNSNGNGNGAATRANSFSAAELKAPRVSVCQQQCRAQNCFAECILESDPLKPHGRTSHAIPLDFPISHILPRLISLRLFRA